MPKHSPGPWMVDGGWPWVVCGPAKPGHCGPIVASFGADAESIANARLFAAAPEMLELLRTFSGRAFEDVDQDWAAHANAILARIDGT